jgi:hypothetical protein
MDVGTPATYRLGMLYSMGMAHLVAEPGSAPMLTHIGPRYPLMAGGNVVPFGYIPGEPAAIEQAFLARHEMSGYSVSMVRGVPGKLRLRPDPGSKFKPHSLWSISMST